MSRSSVGARAVATVTGAVFALGLPAGAALSPAQAVGADRDGDGIPNRWERSHGMNPRKAADARADYDKDRLANVVEYRLGSLIRDEDSDNDGHDDGDEVKDNLRATNIRLADSDGDDVLDGDEDADRDGIDNEDEDDSGEGCLRDDDDRDSDGVADEDENDMGTLVRSADSDGDGVLDGDEDDDDDGESNEDEDDDDLDRCDGDLNDDGDPDEDDGDVFGSIVSFHEATGVLTLQSSTGRTLSLEVTDETEIEIEGESVPGWASALGNADVDDDEDSDHDEDEEDADEADTDHERDGAEDDREGSTADLVAGAQVAEIEIDEEDGTLEEITLYS